MLTLLGSALGFFTSFLPSVMDYFQDKQDKKHELEMMDKQMQMADKTAGHKLEAMNVEADIREIESLHRHDKPSGVSWIDGLSKSVRPVITYFFFAMFMTVEITAYFSLVVAGLEVSDALAIIWNEEIMGLFAAVLSFWFGGRMIMKYRK